MKHVLLVAALLLPVGAMAYPNPNVTLDIGAGDLVNSVYTQPNPLVLAENGTAEK